MVIRSAVLQASSPDLASCPVSDLPEFAFIGRSNVGKSSLVNMLTRVGGLARVSATPGKTRLINFFLINKNWSLVDLPGYGYAKVSRKERAKFSTFVADYLQHRPNLLVTFVLIDARLDPQPIDLEFIHWLVGGGLPFILVFTKTDKLSPAATRRNVDSFLARLKEISEDAPTIIITSSKEGTGRDDILRLIASALTEDPTEELTA